MPLLSKLIEVPASSNPRAYLEIALLDVALAGSTAATTATSAPAPQPKPAAQPPVQPAPPKTIAAEAVQETAVQVEPHPSAFQRATLKRQPLPEENEDDAPAGTAILDASVWPQILAAVKAKHNTLYSIVRMAKPSFEPGKIILDCGFPFHQKRLQEARNKQTLSEIIQAVTGESLILKCIVGQGQDPNAIPAAGPPQLPPEDPTVVHSVAVPAAATATPAATAPAPDLTAISNIFGGAEVLES
jgi:DNA polymerase III gamma/tau subunit